HCQKSMCDWPLSLPSLSHSACVEDIFDVMCEMWRVINAGWNGEGKELRCGWKWLRAHEEEDEEDIADDEMGTEGKEPDDDDLIAYKEEEEEEEEGPGKEQEGGEIEEETIHKAVSSDSDDGKDHLLAHHTDITRQESKDYDISTVSSPIAVTPGTAISSPDGIAKPSDSDGDDRISSSGILPSCSSSSTSSSHPLSVSPPQESSRTSLVSLLNQFSGLLISPLFIHDPYHSFTKIMYGDRKKPGEIVEFFIPRYRYYTDDMYIGTPHESLLCDLHAIHTCGGYLNGHETSGFSDFRKTAIDEKRYEPLPLSIPAEGHDPFGGSSFNPKSSKYQQLYPSPLPNSGCLPTLSLSFLFRLFNFPIMHVYNAILCGKRVIVFSMLHPVSVLCLITLSLSLLVPQYTLQCGFIPRYTRPYTSMGGIDFVSSNKGPFVCGVANPLFEGRKQWWDVFVNIDSCEITLGDDWKRQIGISDKSKNADRGWAKRDRMAFEYIERVLGVVAKSSASDDGLASISPLSAFLELGMKDVTLFPMPQIAKKKRSSTSSRTMKISPISSSDPLKNADRGWAKRDRMAFEYIERVLGVVAKSSASDDGLASISPLSAFLELGMKDVTLFPMPQIAKKKRSSTSSRTMKISPISSSDPLSSPLGSSSSSSSSSSSMASEGSSMPFPCSHYVPPPPSSHFTISSVETHIRSFLFCYSQTLLSLASCSSILSHTETAIVEGEKRIALVRLSPCFRMWERVEGARYGRYDLSLTNCVMHEQGSESISVKGGCESEEGELESHNKTSRDHTFIYKGMLEGFVKDQGLFVPSMQFMRKCVIKPDPIPPMMLIQYGTAVPILRQAVSVLRYCVEKIGVDDLLPVIPPKLGGLSPLMPFLFTNDKETQRNNERGKGRKDTKAFKQKSSVSKSTEASSQPQRDSVESRRDVSHGETKKKMFPKKSIEFAGKGKSQSREESSSIVKGSSSQPGPGIIAPKSSLVIKKPGLTIKMPESKPKSKPIILVKKKSE
ncbi:hypothetical protein ADUPG1_014076, partial [Aduncisulcus paluster]